MTDHDHFAGELIIDEEFARLMPPITAEEKSVLAGSLLDFGCMEPLRAWEHDGKTILVDGHNRKEICNEHGIGYRVRRMNFLNREDAIGFIVSTAFARRNLTEEQKSYYRGKQYEAAKKTRGGNKKPKGQVVPLVEKPTADRIGEQHGVSGKTVMRDAKFAEAVDKIGEAEPEVKRDILAGKTKLPAKEVAAVLKKPQGKVKPPAGSPDVAPVPDNVSRALGERRRFRVAVGAIGRVVSQLDELRKSEAGLVLAERFQEIETDLRNAQRAIKLSAPHHTCPYCKGAGCERQGANKAPCRGAGWVTKLVKGPGQ